MGRRLTTNHAVRRIRAHMNKYDLSMSDLARISPLDKQSISRIMRHQPSFVLESTLERLLVVPTDLTIRKYVPKTATIYRIRAAAVVGHGQVSMREFDRSLMTVTHLEKRPDKPGMLIPTVEKYIAFLDKAMADPRENLVSSQARRRGFKGPADYWLDDLLDPYWDGVMGVTDTEPMEGKELWDEFLFLRSAGVVEERALEVLNRDQHWITKMNGKYGGYR
jgi:hypothetical protein